MFPLTTQLSKAQQQVLTLLASGRTVNEAAADVGIHRNTIANWRRSSQHFRNQWHTMQYEQAMHWRDQMQSLAQVAVETLQDLLTDPKTSPSVRLRAALAVLNKVSTPPPAQPDLHKSAQPVSKRGLQVVEMNAPAVEAPLVQPQRQQTSAQSCTTAHAAGDAPDAFELQSEPDWERMLGNLTAPPVRVPPVSKP